MQTLCTKLRSFAGQSIRTLPAISLSGRQLHSSSQLYQPLIFASASRKWSLTNASSFQFPSVAFQTPLRSSAVFPSLVQVRHVSSRERRKRRKPMTPVISKVKKIKIKSYSSYKSRFRTMNDGSIRRWKEGKRHNAHLKVQHHVNGFILYIETTLKMTFWHVYGGLLS
ncbi:uncharacterized protein LOC8283019 isoform X2 [Ricinus communis]|uniref:uncharacterized protein LOC8283019 isoform X2 n=1 Tax=Ricinus communis TaxID=3988 RepID=UPI000D69386B|nr:uncharacterized protein LOC8283019 isoform X2 [Ricinus communis]|eukprot:XP_025013219.1 uncharacterized protein LOC8283019 isoform X2 [Ricinus communis]